MLCTWEPVPKLDSQEELQEEGLRLKCSIRLIYSQLGFFGSIGCTGRLLKLALLRWGQALPKLKFMFKEKIKAKQKIYPRLRLTEFC